KDDGSRRDSALSMRAVVVNVKNHPQLSRRRGPDLTAREWDPDVAPADEAEGTIEKWQHSTDGEKGGRRATGISGPAEILAR
ncbi:MAG: hypothetical protein ACRD3O_04325, partial [Terriglobia bacterium]